MKMLAKGATHFWCLDNDDNNEDNYRVSSVLEGGVTSHGVKRDNHGLNYRSGYQGSDYWSLQRSGETAVFQLNPICGMLGQ